MILLADLHNNFLGQHTELVTEFARFHRTLLIPTNDSQFLRASDEDIDPRQAHAILVSERVTQISDADHRSCEGARHGMVFEVPVNAKNQA